MSDMFGSVGKNAGVGCFGTVGLSMLDQGFIWLSLGFAGMHPLVVDSGSVMVLVSPSSPKQFHMLAGFYSMQFLAMDDSVVIDCRESAHSARMMLARAVRDGIANMLLISPSLLFTGVRSDATRRSLKASLSAVMADGSRRVMALESFAADAKLIGALSCQFDNVMTVGTMTALYSQLAFGGTVASDAKGKWTAVVRTAANGFQWFSLKGRIPALCCQSSSSFAAWD